MFQNEKTPFQAIKSRSSKNQKIAIFLKGLTNGFGPKMAIFSPFFFWAIQARKMCFTIFQNKKRLSKFKKSKNCHFSKGEKKGADGFGPKIAIFSTSFFQAKQGSKMFFSIFWNEKTHLQGIKTKSSKRQKVAIFVKGLTHGFGSKMAIF